MDYEIDFNKKLAWWQHAMLLAMAVAPAAVYVSNLYTHFLY